MALLTNVAILLLLACISHQLMSSSCQKSRGRRGRGGDRGEHTVKVKPGPRPGHQSKAAGAAPVLEGKIVTRDKYECTWEATSDEVLFLNVECAKGHRRFGCHYTGRPASCSQLAANVQVSWKKIARALRKRKGLCRDRRAIRAGVCRLDGRDAYFDFLGAWGDTSSPPVTPAAVKSCQPANRKLADEHCSVSWSSFCTLFFTMVRDYDC